MSKVATIQYLDAFKAIQLNNQHLQLIHCWALETGLTRFHNSFAALAQWLESTKDGVAAVYLLPTTRDVQIAMSHLEGDKTLASHVSSTKPEARLVLVRSYQQWAEEHLVDKALAMRDLLIVVDLGVGTVSSYASAMAVALLTKLQPRHQSPLRTFSIVVLQQIPMAKTAGNYLFNHATVSSAVSHRGWKTVAHNATTGPVTVIKDVQHQAPKCQLGSAEYDTAQVTNALCVLKEEFQKAGAGARAKETYKAVLLMSRQRFRRVVEAITFTKARSFIIHDRTPAKVVQSICEDEEPGLTVVGIVGDVGIMPRVKGLRLLVEDSTAELPEFDNRIGHSVTREADSVYVRDAYFIEIAHGVEDVAAYRLWNLKAHRPRKRPVLFPAHHTGEMFHLLTMLSDTCPGQRLDGVPCLTFPRELQVLYERMRRLELWGIVEQTGGGVGLRLTRPKGRLVRDLAYHEANIHSLILLAGAAQSSPELSAQARHLLVWLAVVIAHDPQCILASPAELPRGTGLGGPADIMAQGGSIWSVFLGIWDLAHRNSSGKTHETQQHAVEAVELRQVESAAASWVKRLSLPAVTAGAVVTADMGPDEMAVVEQQLVSAFVYNIAMFDVRSSRLVDLLSDVQLRVGDDAAAELVAVGERVGKPVVFAIYTDLRRDARDTIPRNLTVVSHDAVYAVLAGIAPRRDAQPGMSPIDLAILRPRTIPPSAPQQNAAPPQADWVRGQGGDWIK